MGFATVLGLSALAGGSIAGAELGQASSSQGDLTLASSDPRNNLELAASNFDAFNQLGFGDINNIPSPFQRLVDQINSLPLDEKTKRRGLIALQRFMDVGVRPDLIERKNFGDAKTFDKYLGAVLSRVGMTFSDLDVLMERQDAFKEHIAGLQDLAGINADTLRNRARAGQTSSQLIGEAADIASRGQGGEAFNKRLATIRGQIDRSIDQSEERTLLQGQFGGFNPSAGLEGIANLRADSELRAFEQSLMQSLSFASGITGALNSGLNAAQNSATLSVGANQGALTTAANQANAANQLMANLAINNSDSRAAGYSGALGAIGQGITIASILNSRDTGTTSPGFSDGGGFNPNISSGFTSSALAGRGLSG